MTYEPTAVARTSEIGRGGVSPILQGSKCSVDQATVRDSRMTSVREGPPLVDRVEDRRPNIVPMAPPTRSEEDQRPWTPDNSQTRDSSAWLDRLAVALGVALAVLQPWLAQFIPLWVSLPVLVALLARPVRGILRRNRRGELS